MSKYKSLKINGVKHNEHRIIMEEFLGRKLSFNEVVHHKNGDKGDNRLENLELMSRSEHSRGHTVETQSHKRLQEKDSRRKNVQSRLSNDSNFKKVARLDKEGNIIEIYKSAMEAQRVEGYDNRHISACCLGKRKTHKGFKWKFV